MAQWRVYNLHPDGLTHREKFRDTMVEIPAGNYILMDYEDAVQFRGQYFPIKHDAMGMPTRETYKVIKLMPHTQEEEEDSMEERYIFPMDGREFANQAELDEYLKANFGDQVITDAEAEEEMKKSRRR